MEASLNFSMKKSVPVILQAELAECGLACLAMIANFHGHKLDMIDIRRLYSVSLTGTNLQSLIDMADNLGLAGRALKCPIGEVYSLKTPCILHWDMNHFVVLTKVSGKGNKAIFSIIDPSIGRQTLKFAEFSKHFTGICLELTPTSKFEIKPQSSKLHISHLWSSIIGLKSGLVKLMSISIILQLFTLISPFYMQWVVDEVLISQDKSLLSALAIGFTLVALISVFTHVIRSWLILRLSSSLNMQMGVNLLRHLMRLPMCYFESRHIGDIVSRFGSLAQIRERITTGVVETFVDGIMAISVLFMMALYSIQLTLIVFSFLAIYSLIRFALYRPFHNASEEMIQTSAAEQSNFLENLRAIQTIKLFCKEPQRQHKWQNKYIEVINSEIRLGRLNIGFTSLKTLLLGLENVCVVYCAAMLVMANELTVGMLLAYISYKTMFTERYANLIEQILQFKMMRLHLDRIADIALTRQESNLEVNHCKLTSQTSFQGQLTLQNIGYSFTKNQTPTLCNINLTVKHGESIVITGTSGAGKTTLMKIMLGLLQPTKGKISLDGEDITGIGLKQYRKQIAAVTQNDTLLTGSIADNISFFDPQPNLLKIEQCARTAAIHEDITKMTMGYSTPVGDMGDSLSGGQAQRILLARALYQSPSILFLDEATSHLDKENEGIINKRIQALSITKIIIAHRQESIDLADKIYRLEGGQLHLLEAVSGRNPV